jgi:hypothetical protein
MFFSYYCKNPGRCLPVLISVLFVVFSGSAKSIPVSSFTMQLEGDADSVFSNDKTAYLIQYPDEEFILPETANQQVSSHQSVSENSVTLLNAGFNGTLQAGNLKKYLINTSYLNLDNPEIKSIALKYKKSMNTVLEISRFVYTYITNKKIGTPLLPAAMILKNRTGDCTEHSVLTVALLRSAGIPARAVLGMILAENFDGNKNIFVYHMWAEAWYGGKWILVDSTRPDNIRYNRYIAFAYHSLVTEMPLEYLTAVSAIHGMKVRVKN